MKNNQLISFKSHTEITHTYHIGLKKMHMKNKMSIHILHSVQCDDMMDEKSSREVFLCNICISCCEQLPKRKKQKTKTKSMKTYCWPKICTFPGFEI